MIKIFSNLEKMLKNHADEMSDEDILYEIQKMVGDLSPEKQRLFKKKLLEGK